MRTPRDGGEETILLDCNVEAGDGYFGFGGAEHSPDHRLLAWAADRQGSEYYTITLRDIATGKDTGEIIEQAGDGGTWSPDGTSLYYVELDDSHRPIACAAMFSARRNPTMRSSMRKRTPASSSVWAKR